jgi:hypothetical protein
MLDGGRGDERIGQADVLLTSQPPGALDYEPVDREFLEGRQQSADRDLLRAMPGEELRPDSRWSCSTGVHPPATVPDGSMVV